MTRRLSDTRGLTIAETLVALTIFSIVAAGLAQATIAVIHGNSLSRRMAAAAALAQGKVEEFRSIGAAAGSDDLRHGRHDDPENPISVLGRSRGEFTRSWTVTPASPHEGLARVEVTVSWESPQPGSITSVTLICENTSCM